MISTRKILFTDLDGTLLDLHSYSFAQSLEGVKLLKSRKIPIIFCSSKTREEQLYYLEKLKINDPFIVENGSAIFIPEGYFAHLNCESRKADGYDIIELGNSAQSIREVFKNVATQLSLELFGYQDLELNDIIEITGLDTKAAQRAAKREYSETILKGVKDLKTDQFNDFRHQLEKKGISCLSGGRFHTMIDNRSDKGIAIETITDVFRSNWGSVQSYGVGDSENDLPMLQAVDKAFLVKKPENKWEHMNMEHLNRIDGIGPSGWTELAKMMAF